MQSKKKKKDDRCNEEKKPMIMIWENLWRTSVIVVLAGMFSRIDWCSPFVKGDVAKGIVLFIVSMMLWIIMFGFISWIRRDAVRETKEEEEC